MIAKQIKGKDFYGVLAYNEKKVGQGQGYVLDTNITYGKTIEMTREFNLVRQLRPRLVKAVYHVSLNLPHTDKMNDKEFTSLAWDYLHGMGFDDNQYIVYRHVDQEHQHIHIIANRVKLSGNVVSDSNDYKRSERVVRMLEKKYGLSQLEDVGLARRATLTQKEIEKAIRTGQPPIKLMLRQNLDNALSNANDISKFIKELKQNNVYPKFNVSRTTGRVTGVSFKYQDVIYKGSTLGRQYSWNNIIKHIDYEQDRDRSVIFETDTPESGITRVAFERFETTTTSSRKAEPAQGRPIKTNRQPKHDLGKAQTDSLSQDYEDEIEWTPFKLELEDKGRKKRKRRGKGRRL